MPDLLRAYYALEYQFYTFNHAGRSVVETKIEQFSSLEKLTVFRFDLVNGRADSYYVEGSVKCYQRVDMSIDHLFRKD
jgi:hypothetical protein